MREELSQGYVSCLKVRGGGEELSRVEGTGRGGSGGTDGRQMDAKARCDGGKCVWWAKYEVIKVRDGQGEWCARLDGLS